MHKINYTISLLTFCVASFAQPLPPGVVKVNSYLVDVTEVTNLHWLEYLYYLKKDSSESQMQDALPDTMVWAELYENPLADAFTRDYFRKEGFRNFPVVGISRIQAKNYCEWRTAAVNLQLKQDSSAWRVRYYLPSPNEWFSIARASPSYNISTTGLEFNKMKFSKADLKEIIQKSGSDHEVAALKKVIISFYERNPVLLYENLSVRENFRYADYLGVGVGPKRSLAGGTLSDLRGNVSELTAHKGIAVGGNWTLTSEETPPDLIVEYDRPGALLGFRCLCQVLPK